MAHPLISFKSLLRCHLLKRSPPWLPCVHSHFTHIIHLFLPFPSATVVMELLSLINTPLYIFIFTYLYIDCIPHCKVGEQSLCLLHSVLCFQKSRIRQEVPAFRPVAQLQFSHRDEKSRLSVFPCVVEVWSEASKDRSERNKEVNEVREWAMGKSGTKIPGSGNSMHEDLNVGVSLMWSRESKVWRFLEQKDEEESYRGWSQWAFHIGF